MTDSSDSSNNFLAGGGEMGARVREFAWAANPIGPISEWPQSLKTAVSICLNSRFPIVLWWGQELRLIYNDAWRPSLGVLKHPALGKPGQEVWEEIWHLIGPMLEGVLASGEATWSDDQLLPMDRYGYLEESYWTYSYSPIRDESGQVGGVFTAVNETTARYIGERRLRTLRELAAQAVTGETPAGAGSAGIRTLASNGVDVPFAMLYLVDEGGQLARLCECTPMPAGEAPTPHEISLLQNSSLWPVDEVVRTGQTTLLDDLPSRFETLPAGLLDVSIQQAVLLPLRSAAQDRVTGVLILGVNPCRALDDEHRGFHALAAGHVATAIANAQAYEEERRRAELLAELDRSKTAFFSNVSHEFRTPLTLMLGPLEDLLARPPDELGATVVEPLEVIHRNGLRLLRLVNTLLDFSRLEAGRVRANFQPTELASFTTELAGMFRAAVEKAGLKLEVECTPLPEPVYVDRDMWEKVVMNLLSNAFKFTFEGAIKISQRVADRNVELVVQDTGTGVPEQELPRLFDRFHRVENARGRTHEGSGIGLATVQELVKQHEGSLSVSSTLGEGTTFTVTLPRGSAHLPSHHILHGSERAPSERVAAPFVQEALRWLPDEETAPSRLPGPRSSLTPEERPRVLVADDNADMRQYVERLLADEYAVETVADGEAALAAALVRRPDLVLTDVMMPRLDGFGLLQRLRSRLETRDIPVIMLSARAGEESRVEGMEAGADDYLVKPFGARELLARVGAHLQIALMKRQAQQNLQVERDLLSVTLASIGDAVITTDIDGRVAIMNSVAEQLTGWTNEFAAGQPLETVFNIVHETTRKTVPNPATRAMRDGVVVGLANHTVLLARNGSERPIDDSAAPIRNKDGEIVGSVLVFRDVSERWQTEQRLKLVSEAANDAIWDWNLVTNQVVWNEGVQTRFGYQAEQVGADASWWVSQIHPEDRDRVVHGIHVVIDGVETKWTAEYRFQRADGSYAHVFDRGQVVRSHLRAPLRMIGSMLDLTERIAAEEDLRRIAAELSEANRRKTEFLAVLGHELRNPLAPIRTGLELLEMIKDDPVEFERIRATMERQVQQMVRLIDDLLDVSRITQGKLQLRKGRVALADIVQSAVEANRPFADEAGHRLTVNLPGTTVLLQADPARLAQVFSNVLNNATKYTPDGGNIRLDAAWQDGTVEVRVKDDGIGIPLELQHGIFEMFNQIDRPLEEGGYKGLGIGLTLVKSLVEMHGGEVEVRSEGAGQGTEFLVRLPILESASPEAGGAVKGSAKAGAKLKVLVVDDNKVAADMLTMIAKLLGNEVRTAYNGREAIRLADEFRPQVVLMDLGMPIMNGYEAARHIRQQPWGEDMVLVAQTGWGQDEDRRRSKEAGFDQHLVKPAGAEELQNLFAEVAKKVRPDGE